MKEINRLSQFNQSHFGKDLLDKTANEYKIGVDSSTVKQRCLQELLFNRQNMPGNKSFNFFIQQSFSSSESGKPLLGKNQTLTKDPLLMRMPKNLQLAAPSVSKLFASTSKQQQNGSSIGKLSHQQQTSEMPTNEVPNFSKMPKMLSLNPQSSSLKPSLSKKK